MLTFYPRRVLTYNRTGRPIWNSASGILTPLKVRGTLLKVITFSNSTTRKCVTMQIVTQPVRGKASNTEERNYSSFQTNYNSCSSTSFASEDSVFSKFHLIQNGGKDLKWRDGSFFHSNSLAKVSTAVRET